MTDAIATKTFDLTADSAGAVKFAHGFGDRPDTIIANNLGDNVKEDTYSLFALGITRYDYEEVEGVIYGRESGEPSPYASITVELGAVFYG